MPLVHSTSPEKELRAWKTAAVALWCLLLLAVSILVAAHLARGSHRNTVFTTYSTAGANWVAGRDLYEGGRGFVYSPVTAALFAPFSMLPELMGSILWRLLNAGMFLGGVAWWLKSGFHHWIPPNCRPFVFLLLLPLAIGNVNNGQVNPLIIGLIMMAIVAARRERWMLAAFCIAIAAYFKIYPLAIGLLLVVVYPKKFSWRLIVALISTGALAFVLQRPGYVLGQYRLWWLTRTADNRLEYGMDIAPRDLWMLFRFVHIPICQHAYKAIQLGSAAAVALVCAVGRYWRWPEDRLLVALLSLGCSWMLLCGPSTESATYIMLAPAVVLALVDAFAGPRPRWLRQLIAASYAVLIAGLAMNSFMHLKKSPATMSVQPIAAVIFVCYSALFIGRCGHWSPTGTSGKEFPAS